MAGRGQGLTNGGMSTDSDRSLSPHYVSLPGRETSAVYILGTYVDMAVETECCAFSCDRASTAKKQAVASLGVRAQRCQTWPADGFLLGASGLRRHHVPRILSLYTHGQWRGPYVSSPEQSAKFCWVVAAVMLPCVLYLVLVSVRARCVVWCHCVSACLDGSCVIITASFVRREQLLPCLL